jgi:hypothetical protein
MSHVVRHALRHLSRESFAVVLQRMSVPAEVRPNAPSSEQNAPGCTLPWTGCGAVDCVALGVLGAFVLAGGGGGAATVFGASDASFVAGAETAAAETIGEAACDVEATTGPDVDFGVGLPAKVPMSNDPPQQTAARTPTMPRIRGALDFFFAGGRPGPGDALPTG